MTANSSDAGLILEYEITKDLIKNYLFKTDPETIRLQERDQNKIVAFIERSEANEIAYNKIVLSSSKINNWLNDKYNFSLSSYRFIKRFTDNSGKEDFDVTDIQINLDNHLHNFSIKHNNDSSKHPRPEGLMSSMGLKSTAEDQDYRSQLNQIKKNFISLVKDKYDGIDSFSDIEQDLKFSKLYLPICELYSEFINKYGGGNSNRFFSWFSGSKDYLKIISWTKKSEISIQDYNISDILPEKVCSWIELSDEANPYIYIRFSNDWIFTARLKNDSRVISKMQTKFDVKHYQGAPKKLTIKF